MKKRILSFSTALIGLAVVISSYSGGPGSAPNLLNRTGSNSSTPACNGAGCHGTANGKAQVGFILQDPANTSAIITRYVPGKQYNVILSGNYTGGGHPNFGFQISAVAKSATGSQRGTFATGVTTGVGTAAVGGLQLFEHKQSLNELTAGSNLYTASFKWTAPTTTDTVRFFTILNAVNGNSQADTGDHYSVYTLNVAVQPVGINDLHGGLSGKMYPNPVTNAASVSLRLNEAADVTASIYSLQGSSWSTETFAANAGAVSHALSLSALPTGQYLLSVKTSKGGSQVIPFTKL